MFKSESNKVLTHIAYSVMANSKKHILSERSKGQHKVIDPYAFISCLDIIESVIFGIKDLRPRLSAPQDWEFEEYSEMEKLYPLKGVQILSDMEIAEGEKSMVKWTTFSSSQLLVYGDDHLLSLIISLMSEALQEVSIHTYDDTKLV